MSGPSRPSTKGYAPVPAEERIDDDVEAPQQEADDEDHLYTTNSPLLSGRSRGNEPAESGGQLCWYHRIANWRPFRRDPDYVAWQAPRKGRNWRKLLLFAFIGSLLLAVVGLGVSTGVLAKKLSGSSCRSWYNPVDRPHTSVPQNYEGQSANRRLNFPRKYPPLTSPPKSACQMAWGQLTWVPCHEKIWNRSWDNGKRSSLFDPEVSVYADSVCEDSCRAAINRAYESIAAHCTEEDEFDMSGYTGTFMADSELEAGPLGVISTIAKRLVHTCREEPYSERFLPHYQPRQYCSAVMWDEWFIVDGMNAGNLEGLNMFEKRTREPKVERRRYVNHWRESAGKCDNLHLSYSSRSMPERTLGPQKNATTCGWCTVDWFQRKLLSWTKDEVVDPKTGAPVALPDYLRRIQSLGERCETEKWERAWGRAIRKYKASGALPDDWDKVEDWEQVRKPSEVESSDDVDGIVNIWPVVDATERD